MASQKVITVGELRKFIKDIPDDVHRKYKAICILKSTTMREAIIKHMKEVVDKANLKP